MLESSKFKSTVKGALTDLVYYLILYTQVLAEYFVVAGAELLSLPQSVVVVGSCRCCLRFCVKFPARAGVVFVSRLVSLWCFMVIRVLDYGRTDGEHWDLGRCCGC